MAQEEGVKTHCQRAMEKVSMADEAIGFSDHDEGPAMLTENSETGVSGNIEDHLFWSHRGRASTRSHQRMGNKSPSCTTGCGW